MLRVQIDSSGAILLDDSEIVFLVGADGCCCMLSGSCSEDFIPAECDALGGQWLDHETCDDNPCPGACCSPDNDCSEIRQDDCYTLGYDFKGTSVRCADNPCHSGLCRHEIHHTIIHTENHYHYPCLGSVCDVEPCPPNPWRTIECTPDYGDYVLDQDTQSDVYYASDGTTVCLVTCDGTWSRDCSGGYGCYCPPDEALQCKWGRSGTGVYIPDPPDSPIGCGLDITDGPSSCTCPDSLGCECFNCPYGDYVCTPDALCDNDLVSCYVYSCLNEPCSAWCERSSYSCGITTVEWVDCSTLPCGACCTHDELCSIKKHDDCTAEDPDNVYRGNGVECSPNPCLCGGIGEGGPCECCTTRILDVQCIRDGYGYTEYLTSMVDYNILGNVSCIGSGTCSSEFGGPGGGPCSNSWTYGPPPDCNKIMSGDTGCECPCIMIGCPETSDHIDCISQYIHDDCPDGTHWYIDESWSPHSCP